MVAAMIVVMIFTIFFYNAVSYDTPEWNFTLPSVALIDGGKYHGR